MELTTVWFILIAVLWIGYLVLEGFDFGVGILMPILGRNDKERRVVLNTIGPIWDGNEVWLLVAGGPIDADMEYVGGFFNLLNPYALLGGLTTLALFVTHGAVFIALKTTGDIRERANALALKVGLVAAVLAVAFVAWTSVSSGKPVVYLIGAAAAVAFVSGLVAAKLERDGWAFVAVSYT